MTPEQLHAAIRTGEIDRCVTLLATATEEERRAAATVALNWYRAAYARFQGEEKPEHADYNSPVQPRRFLEWIYLCVLGTASFSQIQDAGWWPRPPQDLLFRVLADRRPDWLGRWASWVLEQQTWHWQLVRPLVRAGLCPRPESDSYILGMIQWLWPPGYVRTQHGPRVRDGLLADPELMEYELWRLFEVEGEGEDSLAARDKYFAPIEQWATGLMRLAAEGHLSRERLLDASLDALARDFAPFRAGWFSRFHEALEPTVAERQARTGCYLGLLSSSVPPTVSFALKSLAVLDKAGALPAEALLDQIAPALFARATGSVKQALGLVDRAARRAPALRRRAAATATEALAHESPEAQAAALAVIERHGDREDVALRDRLCARAEDLAASQRPRLEAWLGTPAAPVATAPVGDDMRIAALVARAEALPWELAARAGVPDAVRAVCGEARELPAVDLDVLRVPRLDPAARVMPIESIEDLIDAFAAVLENEGPPDEIERVLDGVSRLCAERPADFERRTGPLRKRARTLIAWEGEESQQVFRAGEKVFAGILVRRDLCGLALAWLDGGTCNAEEFRCCLGGFLASRVAAVAKRAGSGQPAPLLAAPTHAGGWIDPRVFVSRLRESQPNLPDPPDLLQALLRLAPDHRDAALASATDLDGEIGDAVRYALGGDGIAIGPKEWLWVAAARSRHPDADHADLESRHPRLGPHAGRAPRVELACQYHNYAGYIDRAPIWKGVEVSGAVTVALPTVLHHVIVAWETAALRRWAATIWPAGREAWCAGGVRVIGENLDWGEARWSDRVYLEALLDPDVPMGSIARWLLALGLAAAEPGQNGLATDVLIAAIADGRLDGTRLASALQRPFEIGLVKPARWAKTLGEVARVSPLHAVAVRGGIEGALRGPAPDRSGDLAPWLQLFHEICIQTGAAVRDTEARAYLTAIQGTGKAAKLAKALLALDEAPNATYYRAGAVVALEGRIERAERWQAIASDK